MKYVISRYENDIAWVKKYTKDFVIYDRSEIPLEDTIVVPNLGSDIMDKLGWIIDNYDNLPDVVLLAKGNLFKFIEESEFKKVKDNKTFTPLLTQKHKTYSDNEGVVCYYEDGMYYERNDYWYLRELPPRNYKAVEDLKDLLLLRGKDYIPFAPGANYIVPKENILKHSKEDYILLRSYLDWNRYPGEAQLIERGLYTLWQ
jgi:hypothetical protein